MDIKNLWSGLTVEEKRDFLQYLVNELDVFVYDREKTESFAGDELIISVNGSAIQITPGSANMDIKNLEKREFLQYRGTGSLLIEQKVRWQVCPVCQGAKYTLAGKLCPECRGNGEIMVVIEFRVVETSSLEGE